MSVAGSDDVKDGDCKRGKVTQQPPISYAQFKYPKWITKPDSIKLRLPGGDQFTCDLINNASNTETYLKWVQVYNCILGKKNLHVPLDVATVKRKKRLEDMKKFSENKVTQELDVATVKVKLAEATKFTRSLSKPAMTCSASCLRMTPETNGTRLLGKSTKLTPGPRWTERRTGDYKYRPPSCFRTASCSTSAQSSRLTLWNGRNSS